MLEYVKLATEHLNIVILNFYFFIINNLLIIIIINNSLFWQFCSCYLDGINFIIYFFLIHLLKLGLHYYVIICPIFI